MTTNTNGQPAKNGTHLKTHRDSGCFAKLFQNEGRYGPYVTLSLGRSFHDAATGDFRDTNNFSLGQARKMFALLKDALEDADEYTAGFKQTEEGDTSPTDQSKNAEADQQPQ